MKVLVTGATGQLGYDVIKELEKNNIEAVGIGSKDCDITSFEAVQKTINDVNPDAIIHCAAYTAVDKAEDDIDTCTAINVDGTKNLVKVCKEKDIKFLYVSTDYVFDGEGTTPWKVDDKRNPVSVYGKTKYLGELAVEEELEKYFIARISWVYGINGNNFIKAVLRKSETTNTLQVVSDQIGTPTYTVDIAKALVALIQSEKYGVYHVANEDYCSWYEFACKIFEKANKDVTIEPVSSDAFKARAKRPLNSRMDKSALVENGFEALPSWENALERFLNEYFESLKTNI